MTLFCVKSSMIDIDRSMSLFFNVVVCNVFVKSRIVTRKVNLRQDDVEGICIFHKKFSLFGYSCLMFIGRICVFSISRKRGASDVHSTHTFLRIPLYIQEHNKNNISFHLQYMKFFLNDVCNVARLILQACMFDILQPYFD